MLPYTLSQDADVHCADDEIIFDLDGIQRQFCRLQKEIPELDIRFAIKSCPVNEVLQTLVSAGAGFDAASIAEIKQALAIGGVIQRIHYGNTIKSDKQIAEAHQLGVRDFAADSRDEILAIARFAPGSRVFCRLATDGKGAVYGLSRKFGSSVSALVENLLLARELGLVPAGISVHIGSQQMSDAAWTALFERLAKVGQELQRLGIRLEYINLGGGLPARGYSTKAGEPLRPDLEAILLAIRNGMQNLQQQLKQNLRFILEPGRFLVADFGVIRAHVLRLSQRVQPEGREQHWLFLSCGRFNGLYETDALRYQMIFPGHDSTDTVGCIVAGPTCDSDDVFNDENNLISVPRSLKSGDEVWLLSCGAYSTSYTTVGFNGFKPLKRSFIRDTGTQLAEQTVLVDSARHMQELARWSSLTNIASEKRSQAGNA
ncbi:type III PLP-dependent enzyme [Bowmanella denitrificans]|uniref:type III PLP-dependent enzyme n=1 Tax=Bowmanella denitrificans TaxID=366582 RepID=UPI000C9A540B|nr:type III PLP-dependent enzyme [Bowmanella denitrificans]